MDLKEPSLDHPNIFSLKRLAEDYIEAFAGKSNLVSFKTSAKTMIVGDLHGDLQATKRVFRMAQEFDCERMIFLGDYVDRGSDQLAVLEYVLKLSLANPDQVIALRGNHEDEGINSKYGFHKELRTRFPTPAVYEEAVGYSLEIYAHLPLAACTAHSLILHGGIPQDATIKDIASIPRPHSNLKTLKKPRAQKLQRIFKEIQWNDPDETLTSGFGPSSRGGSARHFSCIEAEVFLRHTAERRRLFRGHQSSRGGFQNLWDGLVIHIITSDPELPQSKPNIVAMGTVAIENEDGGVKILSLEGTQIASLAPRRWTRSSACP
jgi:protein phosphatase